MTSRVARLALPADAVAAPVTATLDFDAVYQAHFAFVWRSLRALGVPSAAVDDAAQDVFVVVHRRLVEFEGRASLRSWLFALARGVASNHRRTARRRGGEPLDDGFATREPGPHEAAERAEATRTVLTILERMDEPKRVVFALVELEGLTVPEVADLLGEKLNTVYSRLRAGRIVFERAARASLGEP